MKGLIWCALVCLSFPLRAQKVFTEKDLVSVVRKFHPVARQAALDIEIAEAQLTASRGAFDPVLNTDRNRKDFGGVTYYNHQVNELKIPTWYGIDVYAGQETVKGSRINPEETSGTLQFLGLSVPLAQGVLLDKRRAGVQRAKIMVEASEAGRKAALNDLIAEAVFAYWDWWEQHMVLETVRASMRNAQMRMTMVKTAHALGDRPAIDTLEASTQVQTLQQQETEATMLLQKKRLELSLYLWREGEAPYELPEDLVPQVRETQQIPPLDSLLNAAITQPKLLKFDFQLRALGIEKRLKFQELLPEVTAKYNSIERSYSKALNNAFFNNDYRFGLALSMPLRLSEGRGAYRAAKLRLEQTRSVQANQQVIAMNKVKQYYIEWRQTELLYRQQQRLVLDYRALQRGEETRFANGESSLFLINAREAKTIEAQRKEVALAAKLQQASAGLFWTTGLYQ